MIANRLSPSRGRGVLAPDVAGHREHDRPFVTRKVADDADVAAAGEPSDAAERAGERIFDREAERQEKWARAIVGAGAIVRVVQHRTEDHLRHFMAAGRELV